MRWQLLALVALVFWLTGSSADEKATVFNNVSGGRSEVDEAVHERFGKSYRVVDFTNREHAWIYPKGVSGFGPHPAVYLEGRCVSGFALVAYVISIDGRVTDTFVVKSTDSFLGSLAIRSMSERRFEAGKLDGRTVPSIAATRVNFRCPTSSEKK